MIKLFQDDFLLSWQEIEPGSISLVLTDPPFGVQGFDRLDELSWDCRLDLKYLEVIFDTVLKPLGQAIVFCDIHFFVKLYSTFQNLLEFRFYHIWEKGCGMPINPHRPISETELIAVFKKKGVKVSDLTFNPYTMGEKGEPYFKRNGTKRVVTRRIRKSDFNQNLSGLRFPRTILKAPSKPNMLKSERTSHPTQKPVKLLKKLLCGYSNKDEYVLDPFSGSGSTHIAGYETGRNIIGYEINEKYHLEAIQRIERHTAQIRMF